jgi:hypothetical protein
VFGGQSQQCFVSSAEGAHPQGVEEPGEILEALIRLDLRFGLLGETCSEAFSSRAIRSSSRRIELSVLISLF